MKQPNKLISLLLALLSLAGAALRFYDIIFFVDKDGLYIKKSAVSLALTVLVLLLLVLSLYFGFFVLPKWEMRHKKSTISLTVSSFFMIAGGTALLSSTLVFLNTDLLKLPDKSVLFELTSSFFGILCGSFFIYTGIQLRLFSRLPCAAYPPVFSVFWALFRMISDFTAAPPLAPMSTRSYRMVVLASMCLFLYFFAKSLSGADESALSRPLCAFGILFSALSFVVLIPDIYFYISTKDISSVVETAADLSLAALALSFISYRKNYKPTTLLH